jgi:hypothetical protein
MKFKHSIQRSPSRDVYDVFTLEETSGLCCHTDITYEEAMDGDYEDLVRRAQEFNVKQIKKKHYQLFGPTKVLPEDADK